MAVTELELPKTQREAVVGLDLKVTVTDSSPIPIPREDEILVRVIVTALNPKDWKGITMGVITKPTNMGDDLAGYVVSVGSKVLEFKPGDRIAGYHRFNTHGGSFAEYAILPANTSFHVAPHVSFEEAVTVTLPAYTAAIMLGPELGLPMPWDPRKPGETIRGGPVLIWGAGTAVGAFAIKILRAAHVGPIIAVAGKSKDYVQTFLGEGDKLVNYRSPTVVEDIKKALDGKPLLKALEASGETESIHLVAKVMTPNAGAKVIHMMPVPDGLPSGIEFEWGSVASIHWPNKYSTGGFPGQFIYEGEEFGAVVSKWFERALADGTLTGHRTKVGVGLEAIEEGLRQLREGEVSGERLVYRIAKE